MIAFNTCTIYIKGERKSISVSYLVDVVLVVIDSLHIIKVAKSIADSILSDDDRRIAILPAHPTQKPPDASGHDP